MRMNDDTADRQAKADRVSIRAVLVPDGEDATKALVESGILEPVTIPFICADESFASGGMMGDGRTPNVVATLELDQDEAADAVLGVSQPGQQTNATAASTQAAVPRATTPGSTISPRSFAPIRERP